MSFLRAPRNFPDGPAQLDLQIEQGCDISFSMAIVSPYPAEPLDITGYTFAAVLSQAWAPGANTIPMTVTITDAVNGVISVFLPASETQFTNLPSPPQKTAGDRRARYFELGGWQLSWVDTGGLTKELIFGDVMLLRNPTQGG